MTRWHPLAAGLLVLAPAVVIAADGGSELAFQTGEMDAVRGDLDALKERVEEHHAPEEPEEEGIRLGGALRFNFGYRDWSESDKDRLGTAAFDTFRLNLDGSVNDVLLSAEFRWYRYQQVLHHGWMGYQFTDHWQGQLGVSRVPFGIQPYASHSFWFGLPYYVGLEDDYDNGVKLLYDHDGFNFAAAFYKSDEWGSGTNERYSYDVVTNADKNQYNEESNQGNVQLRYTLDHAGGTTEVGASGQVGQLYNTQTQENGYHWAAAAHTNTFWGRWNLMLEAGRYAYHPENPADVPDDVVRMGAYADDFDVAAEANFYVANLAYEIPVTWGPLSKVTVYENYSRIAKDASGFEDSELNVVGAMFSADPLYIYTDVIAGRNMPYQGPQSADRLLGAAGTGDDGWHTRLNINAGYYF